jgi:uncharacterized protein YjgD (DUF1641 family)
MTMENEALILERLERLEQGLAPVAGSAQALKELRDDLAPRVNEAVKALIVELADVEADFQLEDLMYLFKKVLRNIRNLTFSLDQLKNLIDFVLTVEPLMKTSVPQLIAFLDELERKGVFRLASTGMDTLVKIGETYSAEEMEQMGDGLVKLLGIAQKLTTPEAMALLEQLSEVPSKVDLAAARPVGFWGMLGAMGNPEVKQGMGVLMELTKAMGSSKA